MALDVVPIVDEGLGNSSYVVNLGEGGGLVVDPERDPRPYLDELERRHLRLRFVVETHLHADFVSGSRELVSAGAELWAPAESGLSYPHRPLHDDEVIDLGGLTFQVIATPGHTPEHLSYLFSDGSKPLALFSGGTLMAGGAARTDLLTPDQTEPLARAAYRSIRERLLTLPDDVAVYPTHGSGSFCSVGSGSERTTTIGVERATNPLLAGDPDEGAFVERLLAGYGSYPPYFLELREVNRQGVMVYGRTAPPLPRLSVSGVEEAMAAGAELVDVRSIDAFAEDHIPGAISIPWRPQFATWLGWLVPRHRGLVFVADEGTDRDDLVWAALTVGFDKLVGELADGMSAWKESGRKTSGISVVNALPATDHRIVDVRQASEHASGHISDAAHLELGALGGSTAEAPDGPLLLHCGHGERAITAASLLARAGHHDITVFKGRLRDLGDLVTDHNQ